MQSIASPDHSEEWANAATHAAGLLGAIAGSITVLAAAIHRGGKWQIIGCGIYEGLIGQNRLLAGLLTAQNAEVRLLETRDAHHWQNWRDQLRDSLSWTLPREP